MWQLSSLNGSDLNNSIEKRVELLAPPISEAEKAIGYHCHWLLKGHELLHCPCYSLSLDLTASNEKVKMASIVARIFTPEWSSLQFEGQTNCPRALRLISQAGSDILC